MKTFLEGGVDMKFYGLLATILMGILLSGCQDNKVIAEDVLRMNHIVPNEDFAVEDAEPYIWDAIVDQYEVAEDYKEYLEIIPLTTESLWENSKIQVFYSYIPIPVVTFDGFAVYNEQNELVQMIAGVGAREVYSADLNGDESYELIINYERSLEILTRYVTVYDIKNNKVYELEQGDDKIDLMAHLDSDENQIVIYTKMTTADIDTEKLSGVLELTSDELIIK